MTIELWKESLFALIISLYLKKHFQESTQKIQMIMFGLAQTSHFGLRDIIPPPPHRVPTSYSYILCKIWEHTYVLKYIPCSLNTGVY